MLLKKPHPVMSLVKAFEKNLFVSLHSVFSETILAAVFDYTVTRLQKNVLVQDELKTCL